MNYQKEKLRKPTYNCIRKYKIPRNNLTKVVKNLYTEDYKIIMKKTEDDTDKFLPKQYTNSMQSLLKIPVAFITGIEHTILKSVWNHKSNLTKEQS